MQLANLQDIFRELADEVDRLHFAAPVAHVYNPLDYAWQPFERFLALSEGLAPHTVLLGMNPGPWGMAQTGVPFGTVPRVTGWLNITGTVKAPAVQHPKRPIRGFDETRDEVSGSRFWGWAEQRFGTPEAFFRQFFVANYCPLVFMEDSGRNRTPDKLPRDERQALFDVCDRALARLLDGLAPRRIIGIGKFAEDRARQVVAERNIAVGRVLHPSPASPLANRGWAGQAEQQLQELGVELPQP